MSDVDDFLLDDFKDRELEILSLMADGLTNAAIGEKLFITKETVRWYNKQIYSKLGTSRRTQAIAKAQAEDAADIPAITGGAEDAEKAEQAAIDAAVVAGLNKKVERQLAARN